MDGHTFLVERLELDLACLSQAPGKAPGRLGHKISQGNNGLCKLGMSRAQPSPCEVEYPSVTYVWEGQPATANSIQQDQYLHLVSNPSGTFPLLERRVVAWLKSSKNAVLILLGMFKSAMPKLHIFFNYLKVFKVKI